MKTKLTILVLLLTLVVTPLLVGGCVDKAETLIWEATAPLSQLTDQEILNRIDELCTEMQSNPDYVIKTDLAQIIRVYQTELFLRQLRGKESIGIPDFHFGKTGPKEYWRTQDDTSDKQPFKYSKHKLQAKELKGKQELQGRLEKQGGKGLLSKKGGKGMLEKQGVKGR